MVWRQGTGVTVLSLVRSLVRATLLSRSLDRSQIRWVPPVPCRLTPFVALRLGVGAFSPTESRACAQPAEGRVLAQEHHRFDDGKPCRDAEDGDVEDAEGITRLDAGGVGDDADSFEEDIVVFEIAVFDAR